MRAARPQQPGWWQTRERGLADQPVAHRHAASITSSSARSAIVSAKSRRSFTETGAFPVAASAAKRLRMYSTRETPSRAACASTLANTASGTSRMSTSATAHLLWISYDIKAQSRPHDRQSLETGDAPAAPRSCALAFLEAGRATGFTMAALSARRSPDRDRWEFTRRLTCENMSGRSRDRTCDHLLVREVLYR
jgi:hypothetical protein